MTHVASRFPACTKKGLTGFTIVELLIVVVVIAILAAITVVTYGGISRQAKDASIRSQIGQVARAIEVYRTSTGAYPKSAPWGVMGINDSTGVWPVENMDGVTPSLLKFPLDEDSAPTSFREQGGGWATGALARSGKIGYVSVIALSAQTPEHRTCYAVSDTCVAFCMYYRLTDGELRVVKGGALEALPSNCTDE